MAQLHAGVAQTDITPDLGCHLVGYFQDRIADHIHDRLEVKALDEGSYETRLCRHVRAPKGTAKLWADRAVDALERMA